MALCALVPVAVAAAAADSQPPPPRGGAAVAPASAPTCTPATLDTSARLPGTPLLTPRPRQPRRDAPNAAEFPRRAGLGSVEDLRVQGALSGRHSGRLRSYSQGGGAELPAEPAVHRGGGGQRQRRLRGSSFSYGFTVGEPDPIARLPEPGSPAGAPGTVWRFRAAPGISPAVLSVTKTSASARRDGDIFIAAYPGPGETGPTIYAPSGQLDLLQAAAHEHLRRERARPALRGADGADLVAGHDLAPRLRPRRGRDLLDLLPQGRHRPRRRRPQRGPPRAHADARRHG